jgi:hypothetical protein
MNLQDSCSNHHPTTTRGFLRTVNWNLNGALFDNIVESWDQILFRRDVRSFITNAWSSLKSTVQTSFQTLRSSLRGIANDILERIGLTGHQLALKLKGLNDAWQAFNELGTVRLLKKLLEWINAILGSLIAALPGGEALKEFKEAIEKLIQEG